MKYNIDSVIKRLERARKKGKEYLSVDEILKIIAPTIKDKDTQIKLINGGIDKMKNKISNMDTVPIWYKGNDYYVTISEASELTGIPRKTFYRWINNETIQYITFGKFKRFGLKKLKERLNG